MGSKIAAASGIGIILLFLLSLGANLLGFRSPAINRHVGIIMQDPQVR